MNIELYINNQLCDIDSPEKLGITLKRVFINPSEMSVKDAQKSYTISLPATARNNAIFNYANVEETQGKFKIYGDALLYVDGVLILDGKFRLSEITRDYYRGNLGVPAPLTVKDVFGEIMMNQAGKWMIDFQNIWSITYYNRDLFDKEKYGDISPCIFPLVLYGLLPKQKDPLLHTPLSYSGKDIIDDTVSFNKDVFPPSINCIHLMKEIFKNADYKLTGTALNDERLKNLYMSHKSDNGFVLPWNVSEMMVAGTWSVYDPSYRTDIEGRVYKQIEEGNDLNTVTVDIFDADNVQITDYKDTGGNIKVNVGKKVVEYEPGTRPPYEGRKPKVVFTVPRSGLYKVIFRPSIRVKSDVPSLNSYHLPVRPGRMSTKHEVKLVRNYEKENFTNEHFDNTYYKNNMDQTIASSERYYPQKGGVNFIDPKQNPHFISGMSFGIDNREAKYDPYTNPFNGTVTETCLMAKKGGRSWSDDTSDWGYSAVYSKGYVDQNGNATGKYVVDLDPGVDNQDKTEVILLDDGDGGCIAQVVWLNAKDKLSIVAISDLGGANEWYNYTVDFSLTVKPFMLDSNWLTIDEGGSSTKKMNWNDTPTFEENKIDLMQFLPSDIKINDWIDNFCKAFNLSLVDKGGKTFELNIKGNDINRSIVNVIDLDKKAHIEQSNSEPLKLPYVYEIGFTIDQGEEGYKNSITEYKKDIEGKEINEKLLNAGDTGGGKFYTGSQETSKVSQTSTFSHCWYKEMKDKRFGGDEIIKVPVITDHEVWEAMSDEDYETAMEDKFYDKAQRFWYKSSKYLDILLPEDRVILKIVLVEDTYKGISQNLKLNYRDEADSITKNYFMLHANVNNNYTIINCFLTPDEYSRLNKSYIKFNGDLYYVAEVDGYDPLGYKPAKLKLIRKLL